LKTGPSATSNQNRKNPVFGLSITPDDVDDAFKLARTADELGLDIIGIQDHPYNGTFLDTWSLIAALSSATRRVRFFADVSDLPMRPPAMLAKTTATLDIITKGRIELGIGAGAYWDAIQSYGGTRREPSDAVEALKEAIKVIRLIWNYEGPRTRVSFPGKYYQLQNAQAGPSPRHKISIWIGAFRPRMLRLIGRSGDGWVTPLSQYTSADEVRANVQLIDDSAREAGRSPDEIRRIANVVGVIGGQGQDSKHPWLKNPFIGSPSAWADWLVSSYRDLGLDTFVFWPSADGQEESQTRIFADEVVPKVQASLKTS